MKIRALFMLALFMAAGCGYTLLGRGNLLPEHIKTIQVPTFVNMTTRVELEQRVTQEVAEELVSRGGLIIVQRESEADAILKGVISSVAIIPVSFNDQGRATRYQVSIAAGIELVDHTRGDESLWKNDAYRFSESYAIEADSLDAFDQETRAIQEIAERFAESAVASLLEGF